MRKYLTATLVAGVAASAVLSGAAYAQTKAPLSILRVIDADNYDPIRSTATAMVEVMAMLGDTLVSLDFDMKTVKPGLAEAWSVSEDGKTYTFNLRKDVKFCDGRPMTAADVVYTIERWQNPEKRSPTAFRGGKVKSITAKDDYTVIYELEEPYSDLLPQLTMPFSTIVDKATVEKLGENFGVQGFNGTGPYCWVSWQPRQELKLKKNPNYTWGPSFYKNPSPQVDEIVWRVIPEANTLMAAIQARQADMTYYMPPIALTTMESMPGINVSKQENYIYDMFMGFKIDKPVVSDPIIRKAVNMATNKAAITQAVYFGHGKEMKSLVNPAIIDFDPESAKLMPAFDQDAANKMLDEAGWKMGGDGIREKDGQKATFLVYGLRNATNPTVSEAMQADLRKIGIDMKIQLWDATVGWGKMATQEFDAFYMNYPALTALEAIGLYFPSRQAPTPNRMNWKDPATDELIRKAATTTSKEERHEALATLQRNLTEANVWVTLSSEPMWLISGDRVEGAKAHGIYGAGIYKGLDISLKR